MISQYKRNTRKSKQDKFQVLESSFTISFFTVVREVAIEDLEKMTPAMYKKEIGSFVQNKCYTIKTRLIQVI